jgi:hypothetical protein
MKDFFISYTNADRAWAEWIAWQLEEAGYTTILQAWDFRPGSSFVLEMQEAATQAERTIAVLSPDYLNTRYTHPEWAAAFAQDPTGEKGILLPVRVRECDLTGLLAPIVFIDLVDLEEDRARENLLSRVRGDRAKPPSPPNFPGATGRSVPEQPLFPGASQPSLWKNAVRPRILALFAEPLIYPGGAPVMRLDLEQEREDIKSWLENADADLDFEPGSLNEFEKAMLPSVSILHFSGHGSKDALLIEDENGRAQLLRRKDLAEILTAYNAGNLKLAFLSACHSEQACRLAVRAGIPFVVGILHRQTIGDQAARQFARAFTGN